MQDKILKIYQWKVDQKSEKEKGNNYLEFQKGTVLSHPVKIDSVLG